MKFFRYNLYKAKAELSAPVQFKRNLWKTLEKEWSVRFPSAVPWYHRRTVRLGFALFGSVLIVGSLATSVYAYNSPEVTDGTPLYPLKQQIEAVEEKFQRTPEQKAKFYLKKLQRREQEKEVIKQHQGDLEKVDNRIEAVKKDLEKTDTELLQQNSSDAKELHEKIQKNLETKKERLEKEEGNLEKRKERIEKEISEKTPDRKGEKMEKDESQNQP